MKKSIFYGGLILFFFLMICNPLVADGESVLGDEFFVKGQYEEAIAAYEVELKTADDPAPIYNNLATAYYQLGNVEQALQYFELAANAAPESGIPWINLAMLYELEGDLDAAEENYLKATSSSDPAAAVNGYLGVSMLLLDKGNTEGAISALESALDRIDGETAHEFQELRMQIYDNIGQICATLGENEKAFDAFAAAAQAGTENPTPWMKLGSLLENAGMPERALLMYQEALSRDSDNITNAQEMYDSLFATISSQDVPIVTDQGGSTQNQESLSADDRSEISHACEIVHFYNYNCEACQRLEPWLFAFKAKYPEVQIISYELHAIGSKQKLEALKREHGISSVSVPIVFICGSVIEGVDAIQRDLEPMVLSLHGFKPR
ncbi:MAG: tetratricopeptide repeat protein [Methanomicrobiales archaeon]|nr:tetratricopeptide repeat protein [Methanomicrobiales archaeon]